MGSLSCFKNWTAWTVNAAAAAVSRDVPVPFDWFVFIYIFISGIEITTRLQYVNFTPHASITHIKINAKQPVRCYARGLVLLLMLNSIPQWFQLLMLHTSSTHKVTSLSIYLLTSRHIAKTGFHCLQLHFALLQQFPMTRFYNNGRSRGIAGNSLA